MANLKVKLVKSLNGRHVKHIATAKSMEQIQAELDAKAAEEKAAEELARHEQ